MESWAQIIFTRYDYCFYAVFMMIGLYAMIGKNNLMKKIIGMAIFQAAIILFYVSSGYKQGASIPILEHGHGHGHEHVAPAEHDASPDNHTPAVADGTNAEPYNGPPRVADKLSVEEQVLVRQHHNPLPHVLMLTAIVVGVATLGVALALLQRVHAEFGTIEEDEILEQIHK